MRSIFTSSLLLVAARSALAFPTSGHLELLAERQFGPSNAAKITPQDVEALLKRGLLSGAVDTVTGVAKEALNLEDRIVDISGIHAFIPPGKGDVRGPCPGLNALANHGYLPRNGVGGITEYIAAVKNVFNMGLDIGGVLSVYGTELSGSLVSLNPGFSMGGESANSQNLLGNLGGLLSTPVGLDGTHAAYEQDASATRGDLYSDGDNSALHMDYFMGLYDLQKDAADPSYTMDVVLEHSVNRWKHSVHTNPYFFYGPSGGLVVRNAAYAFMGRLFANYSDEHPVDGKITKESLKIFHAVSGEEGSFVYTKGHERIPENFYRRPTPYGFAEYGIDLVNWVLKAPLLLNAGGNTGTVDSFTGLDVNNITGGVFNAATLLEGNNLLCFGLSFLAEFNELHLSSIYKTIAGPLAKISDALAPTLLNMNCPQSATLAAGGTDLLAKLKSTYPGVAKAGYAI